MKNKMILISSRSFYQDANIGSIPCTRRGRDSKVKLKRVTVCYLTWCKVQSEVYEKNRRCLIEKYPELTKGWNQYLYVTNNLKPTNISSTRPKLNSNHNVKYVWNSYCTAVADESEEWSSQYLLHLLRWSLFAFSNHNNRPRARIKWRNDLR